MPTPILVPNLECNEPVRVSCWLVDVGEEVQQGDRVVELVMPGMTFDVAAPVAGRITNQEMKRNNRVQTGDTLGWIETENFD